MRKVLLSVFISVFSVLGFITMCYAQQTPEKSMEYYVRTAPFHMPSISVPQFPNRIFNIKNYGAVGHGKILNTTAIQKTIDACSNAGGGTVLVPPGLWLTAPIELKSHVNFHLARGAVLLLTRDHADFPIIKAPHSKYDYIVESPIYGHDLTDVAITGEGIVDGSGESWRPVKRSKVTSGHWHKLLASGGALSNNGSIWWPSKEAKNGEKYLHHLKSLKRRLTAKDFLPARDYMRPYMVYLVYCKNVLIDGPTFKNSPKFALYPKYCTDMIVRHIKINNEYWAQNGDGLDIASSRNVILYDNTVTAGDDGICMKSSPDHSDHSGEPALENVIIADCVVYHAHGGFVIGSNTDGGIKNVAVTNCDFIGTDRGLRFKSRRGRGGLVHNVFVKNIYMSNIVDQAIYFNTYYELSGSQRNQGDHTVNAKTPRFRDFYISNIYCDGANTAVSITGLPEMPVQSIHLSNIRVVANHGFFADEARNIKMNNVAVIPKSGVVYSIKNSQNIELNKAAIPDKFSTYMKLSGVKTSNIVIDNTKLPNGIKVVQMGPMVRKNALKIN